MPGQGVEREGLDLQGLTRLSPALCGNDTPEMRDQAKNERHERKEDGNIPSPKYSVFSEV